MPERRRVSGRAYRRIVISCSGKPQAHEDRRSGRARAPTMGGGGCYGNWLARQLVSALLPALAETV